MSRRILAVAAAGVAVLALAGCTSGEPVAKLAVGDCVGTLAVKGDQIERITPLPCSELHAWEAYAGTTIPGSRLPAPADLQKQIEEFCAPEFEKFVGVPLEQSQFHVQPLTPTENTWRQGDRQLMCLVGPVDGGVTGTLRDARK